MEIWQIITTNNNCKFLKEIKHFPNDDIQRICHHKNNIYADCIKEKCPIIDFKDFADMCRNIAIKKMDEMNK